MAGLQELRGTLEHKQRSWPHGVGSPTGQGNGAAQTCCKRRSPSVLSSGRSLGSQFCSARAMPCRTACRTGVTSAAEQLCCEVVTAASAGLQGPLKRAGAAALPLGNFTPPATPPLPKAAPVPAPSGRRPARAPSHPTYPACPWLRRAANAERRSVGTRSRQGVKRGRSCGGRLKRSREGASTDGALSGPRHAAAAAAHPGRVP